MSAAPVSSPPVSPPPEVRAQLRELEEDLKLFVRQYRRLRTENIALRQSVLQLKAEQRKLVERFDTAAEQIEQLLGKLPQ